MGYFGTGKTRRIAIPVIRREAKPASPGGGPNAYGARQAPSDDRLDSKGGHPAPRPAPHDDRPESKRDATHRPAPSDDLKKVADSLQDIKVAIEDQHFRTQSRVVRGLQAVDHRGEQRHSAAQSALEDTLIEVVARVDTLRHEVRLIDKSARRQIADLSDRMNSSLDGIVEILGYLKSEIAAIHYSLDASRAEARMQSNRSPSEGETV